MSDLMRAAVIAGPGAVCIEEVPIPMPGPSEIRVRLEGCGVCASNLGPWSGPEWMKFPTAPGALGHEGWGVVDCVGEAVQDYHPGDRVAALSNKSYAEYDIVTPEGAIPQPETLSDRIFPGEAFGCVMNIFRRSRILPGQTVAVVGIGFLGAALTRLAAAAGAKVIAISRRPYALAVAREMGAVEVVPLADHGTIVDTVRGLTDGAFCPVVIEAVGKQWPLDLAGELTSEGGRLVIAGYHQDGPRTVNLQLWNWRGIDVVNAHERDQRRVADAVLAAASAVLSGMLEPERLLTHRFPLERLADALNATRDRPEGFLKAVVVP
jgi:threonine dehydrogenase-like Zn-dependent dehydrogenase